MNYRALTLALATVASFAAANVATTTSAHACGFIGCIVNAVVPGAGTALDQAHEALGKPLDNPAVAGAAANVIIPGSGPLVTGAMTAGGVINGGGMGGVVAGGMGIVMGNRCLLPNGAAVFGPINPVGSSCNVPTPMGLIFGQVIQ